MIKQIRVLIAIAILLSFVVSPVEATQIWFDPLDQLYDVGDILSIDLFADIEQPDAILGFDFDLSFDGGSSFICSPGDSGSFLTFTGFTSNSTLFLPFPAFWDDGDTISGEVPFFKENVWGTNILLGTFSFDAPISGPIGIETIYLGPPEGDYDPFATEGLIRGAIASTAFMPNNPEATASPVPEPATILLLTTGMLGLGVFGRKKFTKRK